MIIRSYTFRRVTIVGVGLMGGSLGKAIKKHKLAKEIVGLSQKQSSLMEAMQAGAIDIAEGDIKNAIRNADLVILATPVDSIVKLFPAINPHLKRGCIITDLGSTKADIVDHAEKALTNPSFFIGSHPLVGSEKVGVQNAAEDLFEGAMCIVTPTKNANSGALEKIKYLWKTVGATVKVLSPEDHDETLAYISHLSHISAFGLIDNIPEKFMEYATQSLKETTRVAASSAHVWSGIFLSNKKNILKAMDSYVAFLAEVRNAIVKRDQKALVDIITKAKEKRERLNDKPHAS